MERFRIAIVGSRHILSNYGGIERSLAAMLPHLVARGHAVTVFGGPMPGQRAGTRECWQGIENVAVPTINGKYTETLTRSTLSVLLAAQRRFDVVHFQHQGPAILSPAARLLGMPSVLTVAGLDWQRAKWNAGARAAIRLSEMAAVDWADSIVVLSEKLRRYFAKTYRKTTVRIPLGIDRMPPPAQADVIEAHGLTRGGYVLFAARLVPEKGCHDLIEAWNQLATDMVLVVAGAGRYNDYYVSSLHAMADPAKVRFLGHQEGDALLQLFAHCHLFVLPSYIEGLSVALLEALAFGRPVLASDIPENVEVVDGIGATFAVGNVASLRATLAALVADPSAVRAMEDRVAAALDNFWTWDDVAGAYENVYASVIRRSDPGKAGVKAAVAEQRD